VKKAVAGLLPERRIYDSLRGRTAFSRLHRSGRRRRVGDVLVIAAPGVAEEVKVGVVAGRRVGGAVVRNRAKRRLREALARAELTSGRSYIVIALSDLAEASFADLVAWVRQGAAPGRIETEQDK